MFRWSFGRVSARWQRMENLFLVDALLTSWCWGQKCRLGLEKNQGLPRISLAT